MAKKADIFIIIAVIGLGLQVWNMLQEGEI